MAGKVWLVGAGPSDVGLLTVKGKEILEQAQVVVYDRLVGDSILNLISPKAQKIDVGKRAGNHTMIQEEINQLLLTLALEGKQVVRLKGGDPFLFGRGAEELELLAEHEIEFEIVPGVTSAIAVPAYNGIPVTHRAYASSVHIITGHKKKGEALELDFEALIRIKGTLVFLMGVSALSDICQGLLRAGMQEDMPAAMLQQGTTAGQKKIIATVSSLEQEVAHQGMITPAIIVVGEVCALGRKFEWYEKKPLFGKKILVTRPKERSGVLSGKLRKEGAEVLEIASIRTEAILNNQKFYLELEHLGEYQYLVFTSPAGVVFFFQGLKAYGKDIRSIGLAKIGAIGQGTAKELQNRGLNCDLIPDTYDGAHLGMLLGEEAKDGDRILIPRALHGSEELIDEILKRAKVSITDLPVYETKYEIWEKQTNLKEQLEQGMIDMAVFTSASTVKGFAEGSKGLNITKIPAICIGKQTKAAAEAIGMKTWMAQKAELDSLVECCISQAESRKEECKWR
ncbi:MAG: uroporphyrinogen-III C-methyltransferase [Lachnospiraceae bacterium]